MGWCLLGLGCLALGFTGWATWVAFQRESLAMRTQALKIAAVFGIGACVPFGFSAMYFFDIGAHLTLSQADVLIKVVGAVAALMGVWLAWYGPYKSRRTYEAMFHGASLLPALQKSATVTCLAIGVLLTSGGFLFLTMSWSYPFTAVSVVLGVLGVAGALVGVGAGFAATIIDDRLKMDAQVAAWRQRHTATAENATE